MNAPTESPEPQGVDVAEVHRAVGAVVAAATGLEWALVEAVKYLTRSQLTSVLVQGERGSKLAQIAKRLLLQRGIGPSLEDDANTYWNQPLDPISHADTEAFLKALKEAERCLEQRDEVAHSLWLAKTEQAGVIEARRRTHSTEKTRQWRVEELEQLRQDFGNVTMDIWICIWNTSGIGTGRIDPRQGDVE